MWCRGYDTNGKRIFGTVTGINTPTEYANVGMGGGYSDAVRYGNPNFTLYNVLSGNQDLVAYRTTEAGPSASDRAVIVRDLDIPSFGSVGTVDFGGTGAFAPASAALNVLGAGGDLFSQSMSYQTGAPTCSFAPLYRTVSGSATSLTMYGIPAAKQRATDFHSLTLGVEAANSSTSSRWITEFFHTMTNRTITLGAPLPTPTVTLLPAPYTRLQASVTIPSDYRNSATFQYSTNSHWGQLRATYGWLGGASVTLAIPDFTPVTGWSNDWVPPPGAAVEWWFTVDGSSGVFCSEGASRRMAQVSGKN